MSGQNNKFKSHFLSAGIQQDVARDKACKNQQALPAYLGRYVENRETIMIAEIIAGIATAATISGVTLKDLISKSSANKSDIKSYIKYLEGKQVLVAPFNQEILPAAIKSIESIKQETEKVRAQLNDDHTSLILLHLVLKMSEELMVLHSLNQTDPKHFMKMYKSIQEVRSKFSKALVLFSAAFNIDLSGSALSSLILDMNFKPKSK